MSDGFYRAFEERYYAPRNLIKELRRQYLPFFKQLRSIYPGAETFDAGCGRGEWLELMIEQGFAPFGVDLDDGMLLGCADLGLPAKKGDAIEYISTLPSSSQVVVSAFHVVEHITFEQLRAFVEQAMRVLKPGGLLIMETPNPENIVVATRNFYLDPTHQRPIPSALLSFVTEFAGFERIKTLRLQEPKDVGNRPNIGLTELLNCVSPDYAVVAQKKANFTVLAEIQKLFDIEYGLSLDALAAKLDQRLERIASQAQHAEAKAQQAEVKAQQAETASLHHLMQLDSVHKSKSWRITAPLRWVAMQNRRLREEGLKTRLKAFAKKLTRPTLRRVANRIDRHPKLRQTAVWVLNKLGLHNLLRGVYHRSNGRTLPESRPAEQASLSNSAEKIYEELKAAIHQLGGPR